MTTRDDGESTKRGMTPRRRLWALMRREKYLARRISERRAEGFRADFALAECAAMRWAIAELEHLYPGPASAARRDLEREEARRARGSSIAS